MSPNSRLPHALTRIAAAAVLTLATGGAFAQSTGCGAIQGQLQQRKSIAQSLQAGGKKKMDAKVACAGFGRLVANGASILKWAEANKDWCQVPDSFIEGMKADHAKAQEIRAKACSVAAKVIQMEKQAKSGGGSSGLLGGGGLTGPTTLPQGAL